MNEPKFKNPRYATDGIGGGGDSVISTTTAAVAAVPLAGLQQQQQQQLPSEVPAVATVPGGQNGGAPGLLVPTSLFNGPGFNDGPDTLPVMGPEQTGVGPDPLSQDPDETSYLAKAMNLLDKKEVLLSFLEYLHKKASEVQKTDHATGKYVYPQWFKSLYSWAVISLAEVDAELMGLINKLHDIALTKVSLYATAGPAMAAAAAAATATTTTIATPTPVFCVPALSEKALGRGATEKTTPLKKGAATGVTSLASLDAVKPDFETGQKSETSNNGSGEWKTGGIKRILSSIESSDINSEEAKGMRSVVEEIIQMLVSLRAASKARDPQKMHHMVPMFPQNSDVFQALNASADKVYESLTSSKDKK